MVKEGDGETLTAEMSAIFDRKLAAILSAMGIGEGKDDIIQQCGSMRLRIYEAGEYPDKNNPGTMKKFEKGIELKGGGESLHIDASSLAQLKYYLTANQKVNKALTERLDEEKALMEKIGF